MDNDADRMYDLSGVLSLWMRYSNSYSHTKGAYFGCIPILTCPGMEMMRLWPLIDEAEWLVFEQEFDIQFYLGNCNHNWYIPSTISSLIILRISYILVMSNFSQIVLTFPPKKLP